MKPTHQPLPLPHPVFYLFTKVEPGVMQKPLVRHEVNTQFVRFHPMPVPSEEAYEFDRTTGILTNTFEQRSRRAMHNSEPVSPFFHNEDEAYEFANDDYHSRKILLTEAHDDELGYKYSLPEFGDARLGGWKFESSDGSTLVARSAVTGAARNFRTARAYDAAMRFLVQEGRRGAISPGAPPGRRFSFAKHMRGAAPDADGPSGPSVLPVELYRRRATPSELRFVPGTRDYTLVSSDALPFLFEVYFLHTKKPFQLRAKIVDEEGDGFFVVSLQRDLEEPMHRPKGDFDGLLGDIVERLNIQRRVRHPNY